MLRATIELVPYGVEARTEVLRTVYLGNDGTGTRERGNYDVYVDDDPRGKPYPRQERPGHIGRIENFPRTLPNRGSELLIALALKMAAGEYAKKAVADDYGTVVIPDS